MAFQGLTTMTNIQLYCRHGKIHFFFTQTPKMGVNYDKSNLRQKSVKGPKDPNSAQKFQKVTKRSKMCQKMPQKEGNRNITHLLYKTE